MARWSGDDDFLYTNLILQRIENLALKKRIEKLNEFELRLNVRIPARIIRWKHRLRRGRLLAASASYLQPPSASATFPWTSHSMHAITRMVPAAGRPPCRWCLLQAPAGAGYGGLAGHVQPHAGWTTRWPYSFPYSLIAPEKDGFWS